MRRSSSSLSFKPQSKPAFSAGQQRRKNPRHSKPEQGSNYSMLDIMRKEMKDQQKETDKKILKFRHKIGLQKKSQPKDETNFPCTKTGHCAPDLLTISVDKY